MDPITILGGIKAGLAAGKTISALSKDIGKFFDATDNAKNTPTKRYIGTKYQQCGTRQVGQGAPSCRS